MKICVAHGQMEAKVLENLRQLKNHQTAIAYQKALADQARVRVAEQAALGTHETCKIKYLCRFQCNIREGFTETVNWLTENGYFSKN